MKKEVRYIQLPPIPEDIEMPALEAIWLIAKMNKEQRKDAFRQLEAMIGDDETYKMDEATMQEVLEKYIDVDEDGIFSQYVESMRKLIAQLILESYDVAAYVYQKYCIEKASVEELLKDTRLSEKELNMFISYFDVREKEQGRERKIISDVSH